MKKIFKNFLIPALAVFAIFSCENIESEIEPDDNTQTQEPDTLDYNNDLLFTSATFNGTLRKGIPLSSTDSISVSYTNEYARSYVVELSNLELPDGLKINYQYLLIQSESTSGELKFLVEGTPTYAGDTTFKFSLTANNRTWDLTALGTSGDDAVLDDVGELTISNIKLKGPIYASTNANFSESYSIEVSYTGGTEEAALKLTNLSGYLVPNADKLLSLNTVKTSEGASTAIFELGVNFFDSMESEDNIGESAQAATATMIASFEYNSEEIDDKNFTFNPGGFFVWQGYTYGTYYDGNTTWLDRNLGASSIVVEEPVMNGNAVSSWTPNYNTYGSYFQRGRAVGIPIFMDGNNTITGADPGDPYFYYNATSSWEEGSWFSMSTELQVEVDDSIWTSNADGGSNNPCPTGFRVPTRAELTYMIETVTGSTGSSSNATVIPALMSKMNLPLSGNIHGGGPTMKDESSNLCGQNGMVGFHKPGTKTDNGDGTYSYSMNPQATASEGIICLLSCDTNVGSSNFNAFVRITNAGVVSNQTINNGYCFPVRCILHR